MTGGRSVVLIGSRATQSVIGFNILKEMGISVPLVISGDEDPGVDDWRLSLTKAARDSRYIDGENLHVVHDPHRPELLERIRSTEPDLILSVQWRRILRPSLCNLGKNGAVNLHNAPLPLLRGCDPFSWAIHDGLQVMGATLHQVDSGVDTGPILAQGLWPISSTDTAWTLYCESLTQGELLMRESLKDLIGGRIESQPQVSRYSSYHPIGQFKFTPLEIDWEMPSTALSAWLRARIFPPFQLPFFKWRDQQVRILGCRATSGRGRQGEVVGLDPLRIATSRGSIEIQVVQVEKKEIRGMDIADCLNVQVGESLI